MTRLIPEKLHAKYLRDAGPDAPATQRYYTLTHSDFTGNLFLSVGRCYDTKETSKLYTRIMRDEVLAELTEDSGVVSLHVYCHVSDGFVIGRTKWRYGIFCSKLPLALEAIRFGDKGFFDRDPRLDQVPVHVHFKSSDQRYSKTEEWGPLGKYKI